MSFTPASRSPVCPVLLSTASLFSLGSRLRVTASSVSGQFWPAANRAIYVPFELSHPVTVLKGYMVNAGSTAGNYDFGIYNRSTLARIVSSGTTAQSGSNVVQEFDITDTYLAAGPYYMALSTNSASGGVFMWSIGDLQLAKSVGAAQEASAFTLPSTATPAAVASQLVPEIGLSLRTLVA
jgi:hypothetical protein